MPDPVKLTIDGQETEVAPGTTVLQACQGLGVEIPHFCFHERLAIAATTTPPMPYRLLKLAEPRW